LRCRERMGTPADGCRLDWALYEVLLSWLPADSLYRRSEARSGGLWVSSRLLDRIDIRTRQVTTNLGDQPLKWSCSAPFLRYSVAYRGEFGTADQVNADVTERGTGRAFLKSITKRVSAERNLFRPKNELTANDCSSPSQGAFQEEASYTTRFEYDLAGN